MQKSIYCLGLLFLAILLTGCSHKSRNGIPVFNPHAHGIVTLVLHRSATSQEKVSHVLGRPNIVTHERSGGQTWLYQKNHVITQRSRDGNSFTIMVVGAGHAMDQYMQVSKNMTLIIDFDKNGKVSGFKSSINN